MIENDDIYKFPNYSNSSNFMHQKMHKILWYKDRNITIYLSKGKLH